MNIETVSSVWLRSLVASSLLVMMVLGQVIEPVYAAARAAPFEAGETLDPGLDLISPCGPLDPNCFPSVTQIRPIGTATGETGLMRWFELFANGTNTVGFRAPDSISSNILWTLPSATGTAGQVMTTDANGILSWNTIIAGGSMASATAANNTVRWTGLNWVENSLFTVDGSGYATATKAALTYTSAAQSTTTNAWLTTAWVNSLIAANATINGGTAILSSATTTDLYVIGKYKDTLGATGTSGQVLSSTGTSTKWINVAGGGSLASGTANNTTLYWTGSNWVENTTFLSGIGSSTANGSFTVNGVSTLATTTFTAATSSSFFASLLSAVTSFITNLTTTNFIATNATATNLISSYATTTNLAILNGLRTIYGGTGTTTAPTSGQLLVGNSFGGYDFVSTSSLFVASSTFASSTTIGATVVGATATGIFFIDPTTGKLAQDTANFAYDPISKKLTVTGGIDPLYFQAKDVASSSGAYYEAYNGLTAATSSSNTGRLRYSTSTQAWEVSTNGGIYMPIAVQSSNVSFNNVSVLGTATLSTTTINGYLALNGAIRDANGATGTLGQVLSSTGTSTKWINVASGGALASGTATNTTLYWNGSNWVENVSFLAGIGSTTANGNFTVNGTTTLATTTSTNLFATILNALTATFASLFFDNATGSNLVAGNITATNTLNVLGTSTLATTSITRLAVSNGIYANGSRVISSAKGVVTSAQFDVINNGSTDFAYDYDLDGVADANDPTITLVRGSTYVFNMSSVGHPMYIKTVAGNGTGNQYSSGVTNNGTSTGPIIFTVPMSAPSKLYYNCEFHTAMAGVITVVDPTTLVNANGDTRLVATVGGVTIYGDVTSTSSATFATTTVNQFTANGLATLATTTSTNFFANILNSITATFVSLFFDNATGSNLVAGNITATNTLNVLGTSTLATTTINNLTLSQYLALNGSVRDANSATGTLGQVLSSTGTSTKWINVASGGALASGTATNTTLYWNGSNWVENVSFLTSIGSTTANGNFTVNGTTTFATTTSTNFFANILNSLVATIGNMIFGTATGTNIIATGSITSQGTLAVNGTSTLATTSVTSFTANTATINGATNVNGNLNVTGLTSLATTTINGDISGTAIDTDTGLAANSDTKLASQKAVKAYVSNFVNGLAWRPAVDVYDTTETNAGTNIVGQATYTANGIALVNGMRLLLSGETTATTTYKDKVFLVSGVGSSIVLTLQTDGRSGNGTATTSDSLYVNLGSNGNKNYVYSASGWVLAATLNGSLVATNNLSDVANATSARYSLGLGATSSVSFGNLSVSGTTTLATTTSTAFFSNLLAAFTASITNLIFGSATGSNLVTNNLAVTGLNSVTGTSTLATTTSSNFFASIFSALSGTIGSLIFGTATGTNLIATSSIVSQGTLAVNGTSTLATTTITDLTANTFRTDSLTAGYATFGNITATNTLTAATTTLATTTASKFTTTGNTALATTTVSYLTVSGTTTLASTTISSLYAQLVQTITANILGMLNVTGTTTLATTSASRFLATDTTLASTTNTGTLAVNGTTTLATTTATGLALTQNGLTIASTTVASTTNTLYNLGGQLYFNGTSLAGGSGVYTLNSNGTISSASTTAVLTIASSTVSTTTNALYNLGGQLYWNGNLIGAGALSSASASIVLQYAQDITAGDLIKLDANGKAIKIIQTVGGSSSTISQIGNEIAVDTATTSGEAITYVGTDKLVTVYMDSVKANWQAKLGVVVGTSTTWYGPYDTGVAKGTFGKLDDVTAFNTNKFVMAFEIATGGSNGSWMVGEIVGTSLTFGTAYAPHTALVTTYYKADLTQINDTRIMYSMFNYTGSGGSCVGTLVVTANNSLSYDGGNNCHVASGYTANQQGAGQSSLVSTGPNQAMYVFDQASSYAYITFFTLSGNAVTVTNYGAPITSRTATKIKVAKVASGTVAYIYGGTGGYWMRTMMQNGNTYTVGAEYPIDTNTTVYGVGLACHADYQCTAMVQKAGGTVVTTPFTTTGTTSVLYASTTFAAYNTENSYSNNMLTSNRLGKYVFAFNKDSSSDDLMTRVIQMGDTTSVDRSGMIGIAQATGLTNATGTISLFSGLSAVHTGLAAGALVYLDTLGAITASTTDFLLGRAMSATTMQLLANNFLAAGATTISGGSTGSSGAQISDGADNNTRIETNVGGFDPNTIAFFTAGIQRAVIDAVGRMGINTGVVEGNNIFQINTGTSTVGITAQGGINAATLTLGTSTAIASSTNTKLLVQGGIELQGNASNSPSISLAPATSTSLIANVINSLYNIAGELYFNGFKLANYTATGTSYNTSYMMAKTTSGTTPSAGGHFQFQEITAQYGSDVALDLTTTYTNTIGAASRGRFTLKAGKTYKMMSSITGQSSVYIGYGWYNATNNTRLGSAAQSNDSGSPLGYGPNGPATVIFTPQTDTLVEVRLFGGSGSSDTSNATYGESWATIEVIAGQTAVTGQSVDYANAILAANQAVVAGNDVNFTLQSGSVAYNASNFTLLAGRTYELESGLAQDGSVVNGDVTYQWRDNTNSALLGTVAGFLSPNVNSNHAYNGVAKTVVTPATNINVSVRIITATTGTLKATSSYATIKQLGTNAVTEYDSYTYSNFPTGGLIIATGTLSQYINHINVAQGTAGQALTLPNPNNVNLQRIVYINNTGTSTFTMYGTPVQAGESNAFIWTGSKWSSFGNQSVLAEYGENNSITNGAVLNPGTTLTDIAGSSFTLPSAGVWEVTYNLLSANTSITQFAVRLYDSSNVLVPNSQSSNVTAVANAGSYINTNTVRITTTAAATYKLRGITDGANVTIRNSSSVTDGGNSKIIWKKIGGYAAVTGQMVDYVDVGLSTNVSPANNAAVVFDTNNAGNVPYNVTTGRFTLSAGKTYSLEANVLLAASSNLNLSWYNYTASTTIGNTSQVNTTSAAIGVNQAKAIITPSVTTIVELRNVTGASRTIVGGASGAQSSSARVTQIGTTATVETTNSNLGNFATNSPILASGISEYTSSYQIAQTTQSVTLTIPDPTNIALSRLVYIDNIGTAAFTMHGITVNGGDSVAFKWNGTAWRQFGTQAGGSNVVASYMQAYNSGTFTNVGSADHVRLDTVVTNSGSDISLDSSTAYTTTASAASIGRFTLKAGKTYKLTYRAGTMNMTDTYIRMAWYNSNTNVRIGESHTYWDGSAYQYVSGGDLQTIFTPSIDTRVEVRTEAPGSGTNTIYGGNTADGATAIIEVIAGQAAVTGFSVDYVNVLRTTTNQALALNTDILFNTNTSGNIPYATSTGIFTLTAGKTYELEAGIKTRSTSTSGTGYVQYDWVDGVSNTVLTNARQGVDIHASTTLAEGQSAVAHHIYTPTTNQTVKVRVTGLSGSALEADSNRTYASIKQLGSNASTEYDVTTLGDISTDSNIFVGTVSAYINHVNINQTTAGRILGINAPTNIASQRIIYINNIGNTSFVMHGALVAAQESMAFIWNGTTWKSFGNQSNNVIAEYGEKTTFDATSFGNSSTQIMTFTLPSAGVWEVDYNISGSAAGTMGESSIWMQDSTGAVIAGSPQHMYSTTGANGGNQENYTASQSVRITTSSATTYYLRGQTGSATYNIYQGTCSTASTGSCSKVSYKKISGYLAVTGQSVESFYGGYATAGANVPVAITTYQNNGILVTGNVFTLKGGKTYQLKANMGVTDSGQDHACWKTYPAAVSLPGRPCNYITGSSPGIRDSGEASLVYTPSSDTQIAFYDEGTISGYSDGATIFITQVGTTAVNSDSYLAVGGNIFSTAQAYMNIGTLANNGLQFIASSTVVGGYAYSSTTNTATLFVGTSSPNVLAMKDVNLWIQGTGRLAASGTVGSSLIIDQGTTGVATTTNALYALNGKLYYNGAEIYYGSSSTPNQVVASYIQMDNTSYVAVTTTGVNIPFTQTTAQFGNDITYNAAGTFTLKAGKTYKMHGDVGSIGASSGYASFSWYNLTTSIIQMGSIGQRTAVNIANGSAAGGSAEMIFTPSVDSVVALRLHQASGVGQLGDGQQSGTSFPTANIQVIAGASAVTGQTVDYLNAYNPLSSVTATTAAILFTSASGNIPNNSGNFTLSAGKTYRLQGALIASQANVALTYNWYNVTTSADVGTIASVSAGTGDGGTNSTQGIAELVITPSVTTVVRLRSQNTASVIPNAGWVTITQLGTSAMTAETIWSTQGNNFAANSLYDLGTLTNSGLRFTASSSAMAGLRYNASSSQGTFYIGATAPTDNASQNFALYANGTGGFIATSTVNGNINSLYIGTSTVSNGANSATNTNIFSLKDIQLYVDGIMKLAKKTIGGVDVGASLIIDSATSSVSTTTNALYALNGQLFYNGAQLYTGTTSNQVLASYIDVYRTAYVTPVSVNTVIPFDAIRTQAGPDISYSTTTGNFTLKAGRTYKLTGAVPSAYGGAGSYVGYQWYNVTTGANVVGTDRELVTVTAGNQVTSGAGESSFIVTPSSDTMYQLRTNGSLSGITHLGDGAITGGSMPYARVEVIAGNAAVTGQSVDYVNITTGAIQTVTGNTTVNTTAAAVTFLTPTVEGNIPVNTTTGKITLSAGKTYTLSAKIPSATTGVVFQWVNATAGTFIGERWDSSTASAGLNGNSPTVIITPTATTDVYVQSVYAISSALGVNDVNGIRGVSVQITQLGTSATTEYSNTTLSNFTTSSTILAGTLSQYVNHIQIAQASSSMTLSIPSPTNTSLSRIVYIDNTGTANFLMHGVTVEAGESVAYKWNGTTWKSFGNQAANVAAEYGTVEMTAGVNVTAATFANFSTSQTVTLPTAGTWELSYIVNGNGNAVDSVASFQLVDVTGGNVVVANSGSRATRDGATGQAQNSVAMQTVQITTTGPNVYALQGAQSSGTFTIRDSATVGVSSGHSKFVYKKIGGYIAVVGQTVDYIQVTRNATSYTTGANTAFIFDSVQGGNVPYNTGNGQFTLSAGKTYQLTGAIRINATLAGITYQWYNVTGAQSFGTAGTSLSANNASTQGEQQNAAAIITPSVNTVIELRTTSAVVTNGSADASYALVQQLGSSAVTSESIVAIGGNALSATSSFLTIGTTNGNNGVLFIASSTQLLALGAANKTVAVNQGLSFDAGSTIVAGGNNIALSSNSLVRIATSTAITITGFASSSISGVAGVDGRIVYIMNTGSSTVTLSNQSSLSSTTARITTGTGADLTIAAGAAITMMYDLPATTWRVIGGSGGSSASVLAEYGEVNTISNGGTFAGVLADVTGSSFTLPSAGTYEISYWLYGDNGGANASAVALYTAADVIVPNSVGNFGAIGAGDDRILTGGTTVTITSSGTYKLRGQTSAGTFTYFNTNTLGAGNTGSSKIIWKKISGNAPVTGSSVDYYYATSSPLLALSGAADTQPGHLIAVTYPNTSGNIPYTSGTGLWTLTAGKTYRMSVNPRFDGSAAQSCRIQFRDETAGINLGITSYERNDSANAFSNSNSEVVFTASVTTSIGLRATKLSGSGCTLQELSVTMQQVGASAITSETMWGVGGNSFIDTLVKSFGSTANNAIAFVASSTERMRILATGQINVGTTTALTASFFLQGTSTNANIFQVASSTGANVLVVSGTGLVSVGTSTMASMLNIAGTGTRNLLSIASSTGVNILTLLANGNLGIGSSTPNERLTVVDIGNANGNSGIVSFTALNLTQGVGIGYTGISKVGTSANGNLEIDGKGTGSLILQSNATGGVGIGVTPGVALDVGGALVSLSTTGGRYFDTGTASVNSAPASASVSVRSNGSFLSTGGSGFISTSDRRIKKNVLDLSDPLSFIGSIRPVSFNYADNLQKGNAKVYGVIAQDIEAIAGLEGIVTQNTGYANDGYGLRDIAGDVIVGDASNIVVGQQVKLASETRIYEANVTSLLANGFTIDKPLEGTKVLYIGRKVNDLRGVDYEQLGLLSLAGVKAQQGLLGGFNASTTEGLLFIANATSTDATSSTMYNPLATSTVADMLVAKVINGAKVLSDFVSIKVTAVVAYIDIIFTKNIHVEDKICIGKEPNVTCITRDQLDKMLEKANAKVSTSTSNTTSQTGGSSSTSSTAVSSTSASSTDVIISNLDLSTTTVTVPETVSTTSAAVVPAIAPNTGLPPTDTAVSTQSTPVIDPIVSDTTTSTN